MIEKIEHWREVMGLPNRNNPKLPSESELSLAMHLIYEESDELDDAIQNKSLNEIADAVGDLYFVVTQMAKICGLNPKELVDKVYESNMTKPCQTEEEAIKTVASYLKKGIKTYIEPKDEFFVVKRSADDKVLKSINFKEPDWSYLIK